MAGLRRCPRSRCARPCRSGWRRPLSRWTNVPSANPKETAGASPANVLSPELSETAVAWGSLTLDGGTVRRARTTATTAYRADGPDPGRPPRRRRPSPTRTPTWSSSTACTGADPTTTTARTSSTRGTRRGDAGVHHADQPRRRRGAPGHAARDADVDRAPLPRSTARPGTRSRSSCSSRPRTAAPGAYYEPTPDYPSRSRTLGLARPRRL